MIPCTKCYWLVQCKPERRADGGINSDVICTNSEYVNAVSGDFQSVELARAVAGQDCRNATLRNRTGFCLHSWKLKHRFIFFGMGFFYCEKCGEVCK